MAKAGATIRYPIEGLGALGIAEVVSQIPAHYRLLGSLRRDFDAAPYDVVIPIDYPGFNLRVAQAAKRRGMKVLYYIPPALWAWWTGRAKRFAKAVDRFAVILPFEQLFFERLGIEATYVGHPLLDGEPVPMRSDVREALGIDREARVLGIFPGSRPQEVKRHWRTFRDAALDLVQSGKCQRVLVAGTAGECYPEPGVLEIVVDAPERVLTASDAVIAKSGTTTLEAALADTPMVVAYRTHPITFIIGKRLAKVRWLSLVNLVASQQIVTELVQHDVTVTNLINAAGPLLDPEDPRRLTQLEALRSVRDSLGTPGASDRVAELVDELLRA
jgi:lipid-A-disaccharide synthase